ncbi:MAG TPA: glyoxalase superfamily protein [Terriglobales bacterium]
MIQAASKARAESIEFRRTIPILRIFDLATAKEFYLDFLGFSVDWEHRFAPDLPLYMQISRGDLVFHLSEHHGDGSPGAAVFVDMTGLKEFHQEISARHYAHLRPGIERMPWNADAMGLLDPFGNHLRFTEHLETASKNGSRKSARSTKKAGLRQAKRSNA